MREEYIVAGMSMHNIIKEYQADGFHSNGKKYICPRCLAAHKERGKSLEGLLFERVVRAARMFINKKTGCREVACPCGYRAKERIDQPESKTPAVNNKKGREKCKGKTKKGAPCKNYAVDGSEYCNSHQDQAVAQNPPVGQYHQYQC